MKRLTHPILWLLLCTPMMILPAIASENDVWLGVFLADMDDFDGRLKYDGQGVVVTQVVPNGPASKAGMQVFDVLTTIDNNVVVDHQQVLDRLAPLKPGDKTVITLVRDGVPLEVSVDLVARPLRTPPQVRQWQPRQKQRRWVSILDETSPYMGVQMDTLNPQLAAYFGVSQGVLVRNVAQGSPADKAGIKAGDVIVSWDDAVIATSDDVYHHLYGVTAGTDISLTISRRETKQTMNLTLGSRKGLEQPNQRLMLPRKPGR